MFALRLVMKIPGLLWRHRRSVAALVLVAPLALTGSLELFALNATALGYAVFTVLRLTQAKGR